MATVQIGEHRVGDGYPCYLIAEVGINHNGSRDIARQLIAAAAVAGWQAVKFQKRTVDVVYSPEELARPRENDFGPTNGDLKRGLEFDRDDYIAISMMCEEHGLVWFASCWDEQSVDFIEQFNPPAYKIASASLTDDNLLRHTQATGKPVILSTGMSTVEQIDHAMEVLSCKSSYCARNEDGFWVRKREAPNVILMHTTSTYPARNEELNLRCIPWLKQRYGVPVGYSGHERGLQATLAAVALGADLVERHVTVDRALWGSDQAASIEPPGMIRLARDIRVIEDAMGDGIKRVYESEVPVMEKLRRVDSQKERA